jgi:hypothetical protein
MRKCTWDDTITTVQAFWSVMEDKLAMVADRVAPIEEFTSNESTKSQATPTIIRKMRQRKKL